MSVYEQRKSVHYSDSFTNDQVPSLCMDSGYLKPLQDTGTPNSQLCKQLSFHGYAVFLLVL